MLNHFQICECKTVNYTISTSTCTLWKITNLFSYLISETLKYPEQSGSKLNYQIPNKVKLSYEE